MPSLLSFHDQQHVTRMFIQEQRVNAVFSQFVRAVAPEMRRWRNAESKSSVWVRNASVERAIDRLLEGLKNNLETEIKNGQSTAWHEAIKKNDKLVEKYIEGLSLKSIVKEGMFKRNLEALTAFQNRSEGGLNLSQRVWRITSQTKGHIETFLDGGIATGRSADQISRDFRQLLNDPDKRFRRVRNKEGKLVLSQPMKDYHPGRGVYRSARMNALRVSATETNRSYRLSDSERWAQLDFVLGFEVRRSRNGHPCALCDSLVGKYPKDFVFPGWHPFCICIAVPIVMEHEDFADYLLHDKIPSDKIITDIPSNAGRWMKSYVNKHPSKPPLFYKSNERLFDRAIEVIDESVDITSGKGGIQAVFPSITENVIKVEDNIRLNANFETAVAFNKDGKIVLDKRGQATSVSFTNEESKLVKDCVFTHNHPRGWAAEENTLGRIGSSFSKEDVMFAVNSDMAEVRAVTPVYTFSMKRPSKGWSISTDRLSEVFEKHDSKLREEFWGIIRKSDHEEVDMIRAGIAHYHVLWKRISKELKWDYSKKKTI